MKRALLILALLLLPSVSQAAILDNILASCKFDEASGNAADSAGSFTLTNNNTVTYGAGKINNGATLAQASSQSFNNVGGANTLDITGNFTITFWLKLNTLATALGYSQVIASKDNSVNGWLLRQNAGSNVIEFLNYNNVTQGQTTTAPGTGTFVCIGFTYNGTTIIPYYNGSAETSNAYTAHSGSTADFYIGRDPTNNRYLDGQIDSFSVWSRALSAAEVAQVCNATGVQYPFAAAAATFNPWQFWPF
jgi:hypothetical protein